MGPLCWCRQQRIGRGQWDTWDVHTTAAAVNSSTQQVQNEIIINLNRLVLKFVNSFENLYFEQIKLDLKNIICQRNCCGGKRARKIYLCCVGPRVKEFYPVGDGGKIIQTFPLFVNKVKYLLLVSDGGKIHFSC